MTDIVYPDITDIAGLAGVHTLLFINMAKYNLGSTPIGVTVVHLDSVLYDKCKEIDSALDEIKCLPCLTKMF